MSKTLISAAVLAASIGTCGTQRLPPSRAETSSEPVEQEEGDRWAGLPDECRELAEPCDDCEQVEQMRREILAKKCVPVCDAYLDAQSRIESLPEDGIKLIESDELCGKEGTKCSPIEESTCAHAVVYAGAGEEFRRFWASPGEAPPGAELISRFHAELLVDYLDAHQAAIQWAAANEQDPTPILSAGAALMDLTSKEAIQGFRAEVTSEVNRDEDESLSKRYEAIMALIEMVREPGSLDTWKRRRSDLESVALAQ